MAKWSDILTLVAISEPEGTNPNGFYLEPTEQPREVFANKKSVGYSEFYKSAQAGYKTELKFDVRALDYRGEELAEYGGKRYKVLRTYGSKNEEITELTLSDLPQRGTGQEEPEAGEDQKGGGMDGDI